MIRTQKREILKPWPHRWVQGSGHLYGLFEQGRRNDKCSCVLLNSARRFHPDATFYLCLADAVLSNENFYPEDRAVVPLTALDVEDLRSFVFRYDIMELTAAVKPVMFRYLLRMGHETILYFDADIEIFSRLDRVLELLGGNTSFVLTPYLCHPAEEGRVPGDSETMRAGIYNPGFLGVHGCREAQSILAWWARQSQYQQVDARKTGLFVDQEFVDLLPGFADSVRILRDPALSVAYWNMQQRTLSFEDETWKVDGRRLGFYHFCGFDPARRDQLSKHTLAFRGDAISPTLSRLLEHYTAGLRAKNHGESLRGFTPMGASPRAHQSRQLSGKCLGSFI